MASIDDLEKGKGRPRAGTAGVPVYTSNAEGKQQTHSKQFNMRMTPEVYEKLQGEARRRNLKASTLVSLLVSWYTALPEKEKASIMFQGAFEQDKS